MRSSWPNSTAPRRRLSAERENNEARKPPDVVIVNQNALLEADRAAPALGGRWPRPVMATPSSIAIGEASLGADYDRLFGSLRVG